MKLYSEKKNCCGCGACRDICPTGAIRMVSDEEGFLYPKIDNELCINCKRCETVCPIRNTEAECGENIYLGMQASKDAIRYASSSGGIFPLLAEYIFRRQGVVYGAAYDEDMKVVHKEAHNREELEGLKRTKYVQSSLEGIYQKVETRLREDKWVLFCGMPCQTHALRLFLSRQYSRLLAVSLVCYGVPSPGIWESYVKYLEHKSGGKMTQFFFRDKRNRDNGHMCAYVINGTEYAGSLYENAYYRMFSGNYTLRPSCHDCKFCTVERDSDFTIGDFWGIERIRPDIDDGMGTSLLILHTDKAKEIWDEVKTGARWFACEKEDLLQPRLTEATAAAKRRGWFMTLYRKMPFSLFMFLFAVWTTCAVWLRRFQRRE